ncbi:MAG: DPP IV N-terminal domain-containing protein [Bacteroidetes bacterium]|nr:DPP IV N-terminal domain-containing protein [Bacteroidota bacterium]
MKNLCIYVAIFMAFSGLQAQTKREITLDDIFKKNTFRMQFAPAFNVMKDGISYSVLENDKSGSWNINRYDLQTGKLIHAIFQSEKMTEKIAPESYEFSADESQLLITTAGEQIYRHSSKSLAYVIEVATGKTTAISSEKVMYPTLSPDGKKIAWVRDNNLYMAQISDGKEIAITTDGKHNEIINGAVDWVYEEEFSMSRGFEWNSESKFIAFYRFDEHAVKEFSMSLYSGLYPAVESWKYPKAGEDNSKVDVLIYNLETSKTITCNTFSDHDQYLPRIKWTQIPELLSIQKLNRTQNQWEMLFYHALRGKPELILADSAKTYIDISDNLFFIQNTKQFLYTSEKNGYNHIYCFDFGKMTEKQVTTGNFDVNTIQGVDEKKEKIYYTSSEVSATEDHFYEIKFNGKNKRELSKGSGNHRITMGNGNLYYTDMVSSISAPYQFYLCKTGDKWQRALETNHIADSVMHEYNFGTTEFGNFTTDSGANLNYYMMKPANFDASKKYPVLMFVYGGPGVNMVRNSFGGRNYFWHQYLAQKGYIIFCVDNRGTGGRGRDFKHSTYLQLGKLELQDQTLAAKWIGKQPWVDASRIGIWGWSFGGYMSSLCITKSADVFKTAIAVAPVTNWRYYDNIYTERFLRKPQDNPQGYDNNSPINFVSGIKGNYLLIHGTGDDNVHFQNSVEMVNAMIKAGVKFDSEYYPNRNHGIGDRAAQYHLYRRMTEYILDNL